jgi:molybdopterin/thiamine biosynthesis adenylyltransferase/rhodanese-related sulfurtransferase
VDTDSSLNELGRRASSPLSPDERVRYSRHLTLPSVGEAGQLRLKAARVLLVGAGGLGSPTALYLAAAGVGTIGLVDQDTVDVSNLQRQLLYSTADVGRSKLDAARDRLLAINPHVHVVAHPAWLTSANALDIMRGYDVVVDGTDNFATRYLVNDACVLLGIPNVHGSIYQFEGQASVFATTDGPCYRCLYPEPPPAGMVPSCAEGGVLGVLPGLVGTMQAIETIKIILGIGETLAGRLLMVDALSMEFRTVQLRRDPQCPACGVRTLTALIDYDEFCGTPPLSAAPNANAIPEISVAALAERLRRGDSLQLIDVREPQETAVSVIANARLIPLGTLDDALPSLDAAQEFVVVCRSGKRSAAAVQRMQRSGFARVWSLAGGMLSWEAKT